MASFPWEEGVKKTCVTLSGKLREKAHMGGGTSVVLNGVTKA